METVLIKYKNPNIYRCGDMRLIPGSNEVSESVWNDIKHHPLVKSRIMNGEIIVIEKSTKSTKVLRLEDSSLSNENKTGVILEEMSVSEVKEIIQDTLNLETLRKWQTQEKRKLILKEIEKQIAVLSESPEKDQATEDEGAESEN